MPSPTGRGRPAIYCSGACRKAAFEARRAGKERAFEVRTIDRVVVEEHDLTECVDRVTASPAACWRVLQALAVLAREGTLDSEQKWASTHAAVRALNAAFYTRRGHVDEQ
jgi:hypothetical protein